MGTQEDASASDVSDAVGANITLHSKGREVMRALLAHQMTTSTRSGCRTRAAIRSDGLTKRRLDRVWVRRDGKLQPADWTEAFRG